MWWARSVALSAALQTSSRVRRLAPPLLPCSAAGKPSSQGGLATAPAAMPAASLSLFEKTALKLQLTVSDQLCRFYRPHCCTASCDTSFWAALQRSILSPPTHTQQSSPLDALLSSTRTCLFVVALAAAIFSSGGKHVQCSFWASNSSADCAVSCN